jgi:hypothetical protein
MPHYRVIFTSQDAVIPRQLSHVLFDNIKAGLSLMHVIGYRLIGTYSALRGYAVHMRIETGRNIRKSISLLQLLRSFFQLYKIPHEHLLSQSPHIVDTTIAKL